MLECAGAPVGALLTIFSLVNAGQNSYVRCNLSSWCTEPSYAGYASLLVAVATKFREVTYLNISPARHTWLTIAAQGFSPLSHGTFASVPALSLSSERAIVRPFDPRADYRDLLSPNETELLAEHAAFGCISLICDATSDVYPFVFLSRRVKKGGLSLPGAHLTYCRDINDFQRFAGSIGRALAFRGMLSVLVDANAPIAGIPGRYFPGSTRICFRGPGPLRLGDLSYTEAALFEPDYC
jgi:hypothetical protein